MARHGKQIGDWPGNHICQLTKHQNYENDMCLIEARAKKAQDRRAKADQDGSDGKRGSKGPADDVCE
jgi:hypothetical protein